MTPTRSSRSSLTASSRSSAWCGKAARGACYLLGPAALSPNFPPAACTQQMSNAYVVGFTPEFVYKHFMGGLTVSLFVGNVYYALQASKVAMET